MKRYNNQFRISLFDYDIVIPRNALQAIQKASN